MLSRADKMTKEARYTLGLPENLDSLIVLSLALLALKLSLYFKEHADYIHFVFMDSSLCSL